MTFPVGGLPNVGELAQAFVPTQSKAFTSGGSDMDLTDPANGFGGKCAYELYCTSTGNIVAGLAGDVPAGAGPTPVTQTYPVTAGQVLQGAFVIIKGTSTANCIARA
jgi:hypothetical protein